MFANVFTIVLVAHLYSTFNMYECSYVLLFIVPIIIFDTVIFQSGI